MLLVMHGPILVQCGRALRKGVNIRVWGSLRAILEIASDHWQRSFDSSSDIASDLSTFTFNSSVREPV